MSPDDLMRQISNGRETLSVHITRDRRLKRAAHFSVHLDTVRVRVPPQTSPEQLERLLDDITTRVFRQRARARKQHDIDLDERAQVINRKYFAGELQWHTIRWVSNMQRRLGSCSSGGSTDGDIRISERLRSWPGYVLDYVIAHELAHRRFPDHSPAFWEYLARFPQSERARGFIEGVAYAQNDDPDSLL